MTAYVESSPECVELFRLWENNQKAVRIDSPFFFPPPLPLLVVLLAAHRAPSSPLDANG
jgi:hypothetical protein